jgi:hypothetical protein
VREYATRRGVGTGCHGDYYHVIVRPSFEKAGLAGEGRAPRASAGSMGFNSMERAWRACLSAKSGRPAKSSCWASIVSIPPPCCGGTRANLSLSVPRCDAIYSLPDRKKEKIQTQGSHSHHDRGPASQISVPPPPPPPSKETREDEGRNKRLVPWHPHLHPHGMLLPCMQRPPTATYPLGAGPLSPETQRALQRTTGFMYSAARLVTAEPIWSWIGLVNCVAYHHAVKDCTDMVHYIGCDYL